MIGIFCEIENTIGEELFHSFGGKGNLVIPTVLFEFQKMKC